MKILGKKDFLIILAIFLFVFISLCLIFYIRNDSVRQIDVKELTMTDTGLNYFLDVNETLGDSYCLRGWVYKPGENLEFSNNCIVLKDVEKQTYYQCNTKFEQRADVTSVMNDGYEYTNSGFIVKVKSSKFISGKKYQLCFKYLSSNNKILYETNDFLIPNP